MTLVVTILGIVLIFIGLRDVFQQLFNPSGEVRWGACS